MIIKLSGLSKYDDTVLLDIVNFGAELERIKYDEYKYIDY